MSAQVRENTPLAIALEAAIRPKLVEVGWGGSDDKDLSEYIVLMLVNGKSQEEIATDLSGDLLGLGPDDPGARDFAAWLFQQVQELSAQQNGVASSAAPVAAAETAPDTTQDDLALEDNINDHDMDMTTDAPTELNAYVQNGRLSYAKRNGLTISRPSGPKAMRTGADRGGRGRRMMGQINRTLERPNDSVLHRVGGHTGTSRISTHSRGPPTGPRMGPGRLMRGGTNGRGANIAAGLAGMGRNMAGGPAGMNGNGMNGWQQPPQQAELDIYAMMQQQAQMMQQMQSMMQGGAFPPQQQPQGKSLFDRVQRPHNRGRGGMNGHAHVKPHQNGQVQGADGEDVDMGTTKREPPNPEETVCKFNLACTNKDCKFAHQSPAAPPGTTVDVKDVCSFGAACKNRKCVGRHPSPASKMAHQSEQDCKFYPNCQNPRCPFRHPEMPPCRNGGECAVPNCKFTHLQTPCKFKPCTNRTCPFKHEEGQRGAFHDKVWVPGGGGEHVSERKFVDEGAPEDAVLPGSDEGMGMESVQQAQEVTTGFD
jgi:nuclear polyadenylated RNA-binding protein NAB2